MPSERYIDVIIWTFGAIICLSLMYILASLMFGDQAPPVQVTKGTMSILRSRIEGYSLEHHRLPEKLSDLPKILPRDFYADALDDAWGNPIQYEPHEDGSVLLISHGDKGKHSLSFSFCISTQINERASPIATMP